MKSILFLLLINSVMVSDDCFAGSSSDRKINAHNDLCLKDDRHPSTIQVADKSDAAHPQGNQTIVINEILFNPRLQGADFIELYNCSEHPVDLKGWRLANRNTAGNIASLKTLSTTSLMIRPGEYRVITESATAIQEQYSVADPSVFIVLPSLPSYPNAGGNVVLLNAAGDIANEVSYSEKWHFALLANLKGVSLERIDPQGESADPGNWHSAASSVGYATPGDRNSQHYIVEMDDDRLRAEPRVFSADNDGYNDFTIISYQFPEPGYVCSITIFNRSGAPVRYLVRNSLCGTSGSFKWDGTGENSQLLGIGTYVAVAQVFNLNGKTYRYRKVITLARQLKR